MKELYIHFILNYSVMVTGIAFTIAAILVSETGRIFTANLFFLFGDSMYLLYSIVVENTFGIISLSIALVFIVRTNYKMYKGKYHSNLNQSSEKCNINNYKI